MRIHLAGLVALALLGACGSEGDEGGSDSRFFLFGVRGVSGPEGEFVAATSDPAVIAKLEAQLASSPAERSLHINGPIAAGNGSHNLSWSWHFVPNEWDMVEVSIELCDGRPQLVEEDLEYWLETVGTFCPWSSYVEEELE